MMIPARHFAGRAPPTPPSSDSDSDPDSAAQSDAASDAELPRPPPLPRRRRFVARVVSAPEDYVVNEEAKPPSRDLPSGFVRLKGLQHDRDDQQVENVNEVPSQPELEAHQAAQESAPDMGKGSGPSPSISSNSSSSSSSTSSAAEDPSDPEPPKPLFRPTFIKPPSKKPLDPKPTKSREIERREESRMIVQTVLEEEEAAKRLERDENLPDDTDRESDRVREEALWRVRELRRIKRDRDAETAWQNRGARREEDYKAVDEDKAPASEGEGVRRAAPGPFFIERKEDGRFTEDVYNRKLEKGRGGLSGLRVGRDGGRSGRTKFAGIKREDTAAQRERELRRDKELAEALRKAHKA